MVNDITTGTREELLWLLGLVWIDYQNHMRILPDTLALLDRAAGLSETPRAT